MMLEDAIDLFLKARRAEGAAANTLKNYENQLNYLVRLIGKRHVSKIAVADMDELFAELSTRLADNSLNQIHATLCLFFRWCRNRGHMPLDLDPMAGRRMRKVRRVERRRVPASQFGELLDAVDHPRDRMVIALGLYLMLRQSEIADLRVGDVDLSSGEVAVRIFKTRDSDVMPISSELDRELRAWLTFYAEKCGPLKHDWYLVPAKDLGPINRNEAGKVVRLPLTDVICPTRKMVKVERVVQRGLAGIGWPTHDEQGKPLRTGAHTLRASSARALFDELVSQGYDGALRTVQAFLHHANGTMTERYLGLEIDRSQRNKKFNGSPLLPSQAAENVVPLRSVVG